MNQKEVAMYKILSFIILIIFYGVYIAKMLIQRSKGIKTDQMAKGKKEKKLFLTELIMKIATYSVVLVSVLSIIFDKTAPNIAMLVLGIVLGLLGDLVFLISVVTMRDNWRAGIPQEDKTNIVTYGIYKISRNPAFLGFDLVYLSVLVLNFNFVLLLFSLFAMTMLHLQILQEEKFLEKTFGKEYLDYKSKVFRYFGRKI